MASAAARAKTNASRRKATKSSGLTPSKACKMLHEKKKRSAKQRRFLGARCDE